MSSAVSQSVPNAVWSRPAVDAARPIPRADGHWLLGSAKEFAHAPHLFVAEQGRRNGSLTQFRVLHKRFLATASPDVAHQILVTHRNHYERSAHYKRLAVVIGNGLATSEGATWRKRRALINPLLRGEHLKQLVPTVCDSVCEVLRDWEDKRVSGTAVEVVSETQRLAMGAISRMLLSTDIGQDTSYRLGSAMREAMRLLREYNTSLFPIPLSCPVHRSRKLNGHRETLDRFIDSHIKSRLANGQPDQPDFLSVLMAAKDLDSGEPLPLQALIDETKTLFIAGFETTAGVMAWALYLLASHPECAAQWQEEVDRVLARPQAAVGRLAQVVLHHPGSEGNHAPLPARLHAGAAVRAGRPDRRLQDSQVGHDLDFSVWNASRPGMGSGRGGIPAGALCPQGERPAYSVYAVRHRQACLRGQRLHHDRDDHHACHTRPALPVNSRRQ